MQMKSWLFGCCSRQERSEILGERPAKRPSTFLIDGRGKALFRPGGGAAEGQGERGGEKEVLNDSGGERKRGERKRGREPFLWVLLSFIRREGDKSLLDRQAAAKGFKDFEGMKQLEERSKTSMEPSGGCARSRHPFWCLVRSWKGSRQYGICKQVTRGRMSQRG
jgi:hypothetical protein